MKFVHLSWSKYIAFGIKVIKVWDFYITLEYIIKGFVGELFINEINMYRIRWNLCESFSVPLYRKFGVELFLKNQRND